MSIEPASTKTIGVKVKKQIRNTNHVTFNLDHIVGCVVRGGFYRHPSYMDGDPYWYFVAETCGLGSTSAIALCELYGVDPHAKLPHAKLTID